MEIEKSDGIHQILVMAENKWWIIETFLNKDKIDTVGKPKSNWREKVYPKPRIWITKETLKNKGNGK